MRVRIRRLACIAVAAACCAIAAPDLRKEALDSVRQAFREKDPSLDWFWTDAKKSLDSTHSVMVVAAAPTETRPVGVQRTPQRVPIPGKTQIGVFVVAGPSNRVELAIDIFRADETQGSPLIGRLGPGFINLHFYSDYGIYGGSIKYFYDLSGEKPPAKFRYGMPALTSSELRNGRIVYSGSSLGRALRVDIEPRPGNALPLYKITELPAPESEPAEKPVSLRLPDRGLLEVSNTPPGQAHRAAGFWVTQKSGAREFYPVPVATMEMYRKLRPNDQAPGELENNIGPVAREGSTIWFANAFYDGEGTSGVGAIGSFDTRTHRYRMRYLPEIVRWSGSAMRLDGDNLWIGLMHQGEGAAEGGGLLEYNIKTGEVRKYNIPDYIYTIDRLRDTVYCGAFDGVYAIRGGDVRHMAFEPDATGKLVMVAGPAGPN